MNASTESVAEETCPATGVDTMGNALACDLAAGHEGRHGQCTATGLLALEWGPRHA